MEAIWLLFASSAFAAFSHWTWFEGWSLNKMLFGCLAAQRWTNSCVSIHFPTAVFPVSNSACHCNPAPASSSKRRGGKSSDVTKSWLDYFILPSFILVLMQESSYCLNLIGHTFISQFIYFRSQHPTLTIFLVFCKRLETQPVRMHKDLLFSFSFLVVSCKGRVENWGRDNICHQFALHFHLAWLLSIFIDSFRCRYIDGIYLWQTAQWASLSLVQSDISQVSDFHLFNHLFIW